MLAGAERFSKRKEILEQRPRNSVKKWDQLRAIGFSSFNVAFLLWGVSRCGCGDGVYYSEHVAGMSSDPLASI